MKLPGPGVKKAGLPLLAAGLALLPVFLAFALDAAFPPDLSRYEDLSVEVRAGDGRLLRGFLSSDDKWRLKTGVADVDPLYLTYLKTYEDRRFDSHWGVDPYAGVRALGQALVSGHIVSGASTLTMQAARLLEPGPRGLRTKARQAARALQLEWRYSKDEILGIYLTLAPFGGNIEGVRAASLAYFGKEPGTLTTAEAALLVALPQSPESLRPDRHGGRARAGRDKVLRRLADQGVLTAVLMAEAREVPVPEHRSLFPFVAPRFAQNQKAFGTPSQPVVATTIDYDLQFALEAFARAESSWFPDRASMAVLVVDNKTREVRAYLGGLDFWGTYGQVDLVRAVRSPGSTLKPVIYGLSFDDLPLHPETLLNDEPMTFGDYAPQNFSKDFHGMVTVREALQMSLNVPAVALLDRLGPERLNGAIKRTGAHLVWPDGGEKPRLPMALGGVGINLRDLTGLYVMLANQGEGGALRDRKDAPERPARRVMSARAAYYIADILSGSPVPAGWGRGQGLKRPRKIAFKTGTSYGFRDAWALGYSPGYTVGVWLGRPDGSARAGQFGLAAAAPMLLNIFDLLPAEAGADWPVPPGALGAATNQDLPQPMRRFVTKSAALGRGGVPRGGPQIAFPPDGATLALGNEDDDRLLELRAVGGEAPYRWMVEGELLAQSEYLVPTYWRARSPGFVRLVVIDSAGRSARAEFRIQFDP